ncbi:MAG: M20/M25/M40 family metallo-hydrolase, partial [Deltaproteobacteria bacterium]|nr:M20/M25/M40 family metallo-hydrolase [Deltaproteobacteria bacterium]
RILPRYPTRDVISLVEDISGKLAKELNLSISVEPHYRQDAPDPTPADAPVVRALEKAIRRVKGLDAKPMGIGGGTVAAFFRRVGLPVAVWITTSDSAHQPNELCLISDIISDAKVFACLYLDQYK